MKKIKELEQSRSIHIGSWKIADFEDIALMEAQGSYTHIFFRSGEKVFVSTSLAKLGERLITKPNFIRINRKYIINVDLFFTQEFSLTDKMIFFRDKSFLVSRRKNKSFKTVFKNMYNIRPVVDQEINS